jgi:TonB-linked SusC/RagA family outer membrane protein
MENNIRGQLIMVSKKILYGFFLQLIFCSVLLANTGNAQRKNIEKVKIEVGAENISLENLFKQIERKSGFVFTYNSSMIDIDQKVSLVDSRQSVYKVLEDLARQTDLSFVQVNENIHVRKNPNNTRLDVSIRETQRVTISGTVRDAVGAPLPGVTVLVEGTTNGTVTDVDGQYEVTAEEGSILVFSFIGYETVRMTVGAQTVIDVTMSEDAQALDEVVVIGFGERKKKDITGSIGIVESKAIERIPFTSPQFALQGNTPGVRVVNTSGNPSDAPQIFIRGIGTWNGASQPLYVVDGQVLTTPTAGNVDLIGTINPFSLINPQDIESISVLKDASAAAIYGSRAANGVVLITTKKGRKGKSIVEFDAVTTVQNIPRFDVLSSEQLIPFYRDIFNANSNPDVTLENNLYGRNELNPNNQRNGFHPQLDPMSPFYIGETPGNYNWQDQVRNKNSLNQLYNVRISGANEDTDYMVGVGYNKQESVLKGNDFQRFNLTFNINSKIGNYINVGLTYRGSYQTSEDNDVNDLTGSAAYLPWQPIYDANDPYGYARPTDPFPDGNDQWSQVRLYGAGSRNNLPALLDITTKEFELLRNLAQGYVEILPFDGLVLRGGLSLDLTNQERTHFEPLSAEYYKINGKDPSLVGNGASYATLGYRNNRFFNFQGDFTASYRKSFGKHSVDLLAGIQEQFIKQFNKDLSTTNVSTDDYYRAGIANEQQYVTGFAGRNNERFWYGYVGRAGYNYDSKYYLDFSFRRDGSSGFPDDKKLKWGNFYAVSGAWRLSSEAFAKNIGWINDLKLKAGWGQAGNDEAVVGQFAYLSTVVNQGSYTFGKDPSNIYGNYNTGRTVPGFPNQNFTWEVVTTTNVGLEGLFLNNRVNATVEYFNRETDGILQYVNLPPSVGTNSPAFNVGSLRNRGLEMDLGYTHQFNQNISVNLTGNITFLKNEVTSLYEGQPLDTRFGRVEEGRSVGHIWGYQVGGLFRTEAEIQAYYANLVDRNIPDLNFVAPGDLYFKDIGGQATEEERFYSTTPDGYIDEYDRTEIGNTIPGHVYGVNLSATFWDFDLSLNFYGEGDVDKYNSVRASFEGASSAGTNYWPTVLNAWTPQNSTSGIPRAVAGDPARNNRYSDRFVDQAGFLRLNTWQLGYSLPASLLQRSNVINRCRIYIGGQNNLLITNWSGIDPVNDSYPLPRGYSFGINARF